MDQFSLQSERYTRSVVLLKVLKISPFIVVIIGVMWAYNHQDSSYRRNLLLQEKAQQEEKMMLINKQTQEAITKRDTSLCPKTEPVSGQSTPFNEECIQAIKRLAMLDGINDIIIRAKKEKNEKLCSLIEGGFKDVCIQTVHDTKDGITKTISNPLLGY